MKKLSPGSTPRPGWVVVTILAALLSACGASDSSGPDVTSSMQLQPCARQEGTAGPINNRAECGHLVVPENPERPEGRKISLNVLRLPAIASSPRPDPLFVFVGGPGEAATDLADRLPPLFQRVNQDRDIVLLDQRGTGQSNPLNCPPAEEPDYSLPAREMASRQRQLLRQCLARYEADLRFYTTPFAVDDADRLRRALGYQSINLWGGSYGTRAALVYLRRHPEAVRSAVLDSVAPPGIRLPHHALTDADRALERLFDHCQRKRTCRERFGDLASRTRSLIGELNREPRLIELEHPLSQQTLEVRLSGELLANLLRLALYQRDLSPLIPLTIDSASRGDFRPLALMLTSSGEIADHISVGLQQTILCAEDVPGPSVPAGEGQSLLQLQLVEDVRQVCAFWPRGELPGDYFEPVHSSAPVLLLSGELDPVTPPRWADRAARTLPNSRHIQVPGGHHIVSHLGCVDELILRFLDTADPAPLDTGCVKRIDAFPPFVDGAGPAMTEAAND